MRAVEGSSDGEAIQQRIQNFKYNFRVVFPWSNIMSVRGDNGGLQRNRRPDRAPVRRNTYDLRRNNLPLAHPLHTTTKVFTTVCANYTFT